MSNTFENKRIAKQSRVPSSEQVSTRIKVCIDADDLEGALKLMNGIIAEKVGYHGRRLGMIHSSQEDCIQEALITVITKWKLVSKSKNPIAYVRKIAFHSVIDSFRKQRKIREDQFPEIDPDSENSSLMEFQQDLMPQPDNLLLISESNKLFTKALEDVYKNNQDCRESLELYQEAQNNDQKFKVFCQKIHLKHQAAFTRFRRCVDKIINHHLFPEFWEIVARLYPSINKRKQEKLRPGGNLK